MAKQSIILWGGVAIFLVASVLLLIFLSLKSDTNSGNLEQITPSDWIRGAREAQAIIIEYGDFQCPACAAYYPIIKRLEEKFGSQIGFAYRHFPLTQIHRNAELASLAAEAAGSQGKFWEMHDLLFENQRMWSASSNARDIFLEYARQLQLAEDQFSSSLDSKEFKDKISSSYKRGVSLGVNSTPTFFLNGRKMQSPRTYEEFERIISETVNQ